MRRLFIMAALLASFGAQAQVTRITSQDAVGSTRNGNSVSATWPAATTAGNLLIACACSCNDAVIPEVPSGWTAITAVVGSGGVRCYKKENADSESGTVTVTGTGSLDLVLVIHEFSGATESSTTYAVGLLAQNSTTTFTANSGAGVMDSGDMALSFICVRPAITLDSPTNDFVEATNVSQAAGPAGDRGYAATHTKALASTGTQSHNVTASGTGDGQSIMFAIAAADIEESPVIGPGSALMQAGD